MQSTRNGQRVPVSYVSVRWIVTVAIILTTISALEASTRATGARNKPTLSASARQKGVESNASVRLLNVTVKNGAGCVSGCAGESRSKSKIKKSAKAEKQEPCHNKGYVDPKIAKKYNSAMRDMKREGIKPQVTSAWRSSQRQAQLHKCSRSRRCRQAHPGLYYALPAGKSLHEAGFAVDISGIAAGPRGGKRLTPRGRKIVGIMRKNGFSWRYGLADPAHFEADPRKHGYRTLNQAINRNQKMCDAKLAKNTRSGKKPARASQTASSKKPGSARQIRAQVTSAKARRQNS